MNTRNFKTPYRRDSKGPLCRIPICPNRVKPPRRSFCSKECISLHVRFFMSFRDAVGYIGHWRCVLCGKQCRKLDGIIRHTDHPWEADHIVPLVEGGETTLDNGRVLCADCHRKATRELRARLAARKLVHKG